MEDDPVRDGGVEHTGDVHAVKVQVRILRRAEAADEGHRAQAGGGTRPRVAHAQEDSTARTKCRKASFLSVAAPARVTDAVKARLDAATHKVLTDPAVIAEFRDKYSTTVAYESGDAFAKFVSDQYEFNKGFLKTLKLN